MTTPQQVSRKARAELFSDGSSLLPVVRARAPLRMSFAGGGTDVSPYPEERGGAVLNVTIDKYTYAAACQRENGSSIRFLGTDGVVNGSERGDQDSTGILAPARAVVEYFPAEKGCDLTIDSDARMGAGLGSSSTLVVATVGAVARLCNTPATLYEIAETAYYIERVRLGYKGGRQDQFSATFGGFNFIEFKGNQTVVNPLRLRPDLLNELHYRLLLVFTGRSRVSAEIISSQQERYQKKHPETVAALDRTKALAYEMKDTLLQGHLDELGELLNEGWQQKKRFTDQISNPYIDELWDRARENGAIGGKLLGAGAGGHMLFLCQPETKHRVATELASMGAQPVDFTFDMDGLQVWTVNSR